MTKRQRPRVSKAKYVNGLKVIKATGLGQDALDNPGKYNGFMGISLRNRFFSKKNIEIYAKWASNQFKEFAIVLFDDPDKYNFMAFQDLSEKEALKKVREMSDDSKRAYSSIIRKLDLKNVKILQFRDFVEEKEFKKIFDVVKKLADKDEQFRAVLRKETELNIGDHVEEHVKKNMLSEEEAGALWEKLLVYMVMEAATVVYLTGNRYSVEIEPIQQLESIEMTHKEIRRGSNDSEEGHLALLPKGTTFTAII